MKKTVIFVVMALCLAGTVFGANVMPVKIDGNPRCEDIGPGYIGYKIDPPVPGKYTTPDGMNISLKTDGTYFSWKSTRPVEAVLSKGGPRANAFFYGQGSQGDEMLYSPTNPSGKPAGLSHATFCYKKPVPVVVEVETPTGHVPEFGSALGLGLSLVGIGAVISWKRRK